MPRAKARSGKSSMTQPACQIDMIYRKWKESPAVRMVAIKTDRLFQPAKSAEGHVKMSIKDAALNKYVLTPLLILMAESPGHPLPIIKDLAREKHGLIFLEISPV